MALSDKERGTRYRARHIALGLCRRCSEVAAEGVTLCQRHAEEARARNRQWRKDNPERVKTHNRRPEVRAKRREYMRMVRAERKSAKALVTREAA